MASITLQQAMEFNLTGNIFVSILFVGGLCALLYLVLTRKEVRGYFSSNSGIALLVSIGLIYTIGANMGLPDILGYITNILYTIVILPFAVTAFFVQIFNGFMSIKGRRK